MSIDKVVELACEIVRQDKMIVDSYIEAAERGINPDHYLPISQAAQAQSKAHADLHRAVEAYEASKDDGSYLSKKLAHARGLANDAHNQHLSAEPAADDHPAQPHWIIYWHSLGSRGKESKHKLADVHRQADAQFWAQARAQVAYLCAELEWWITLHQQDTEDLYGTAPLRMFLDPSNGGKPAALACLGDMEDQEITRILHAMQATIEVCQEELGRRTKQGG